MVDSIVINGIKVEIHLLTFKELGELEEKFNIDFTNIKKQSIRLYGSLLALFMKTDYDKACDEIDKMLENGGSTKDLDPIVEALTECRFFHQKPKEEVKEAEPEAQTNVDVTPINPQSTIL